jgi:hypothetical protein
MKNNNWFFDFYYVTILGLMAVTIGSIGIINNIDLLVGLGFGMLIMFIINISTSR